MSLRTDADRFSIRSPTPAMAWTTGQDISNPNSDQLLLDAKSEVAEAGQEKQSVR